VLSAAGAAASAAGQDAFREPFGFGVELGYRPLHALLAFGAQPGPVA
jgi:hypothetical protein